MRLKRQRFFSRAANTAMGMPRCNFYEFQYFHNQKMARAASFHANVFGGIVGGSHRRGGGRVGSRSGNKTASRDGRSRDHGGGWHGGKSGHFDTSLCHRRAGGRSDFVATA